jgi:hypothetical protein
VQEIYLFFKQFRADLGPTKPTAMDSLSLGVKQLTIHYLLVPKLRMSEIKPLLPLYAIMESTGTTVPLILPS